MPELQPGSTHNRPVEAGRKALTGDGSTALLIEAWYLADEPATVWAEDTSRTGRNADVRVEMREWSHRVAFCHEEDALMAEERAESRNCPNKLVTVVLRIGRAGEVSLF